jgi:hypothetical protein
MATANPFVPPAAAASAAMEGKVCYFSKLLLPIVDAVTSTPGIDGG